MGSVYTDEGKNVLLNRGYKNDPDYTEPKYIMVSSNIEDPSASDTEFESLLSTSYDTLDDMDTTTDWSESDDGQAVELNDTEGEYREGDACLNFPVSYSSGSASWSKSFSSVDLSDKYVGFYFYIESRTSLENSDSALTIDLGTDGLTDYNSYEFPRSKIVNGWNYLTFFVDDFDSEEGLGATLSDVTDIKITVKTQQSLSGNEMRFDFISYFSESDAEISFASGYPIFNETDNTVSTRTTVEATVMNEGTPDIGKIYIANDDPDKKIISIHSLVNAISKTNKTRLTFTEEVEQI